MMKGQVGLLLLVVIGVVVGLIMSIASRSLSDSALSRQGKENNTTFSVAENGVEAALKSLAEGTIPSGTFSIKDSNDLIAGSYQVKQSSFELYVKEGVTAQIDLTGAVSDVSINWVSKSNNEAPVTCLEGSGTAPASLEITLYDLSNNVSRSYYNSSSSGCDLSGSNNFINTGAGEGSYLSKVVVTAAQISGKKFMRLKPIYNGATLKITGNEAIFASQLYLVQSMAVGGDARKEIEVKRSPELAGSVFDFALFSGGVITK